MVREVKQAANACTWYAHTCPNHQPNLQPPNWPGAKKIIAVETGAIKTVAVEAGAK